MLIHKSKVAMTIGIASSWSWTYKSTQHVTIDGRISLNYVLRDEKTSFGSNLNANFHIQIFSHVFKGNNPFAMNKIKSYRNNCWTSSNFFSLVRSFAHKKNCNCTWGYFGTFFGWLHGPKTLISIHCLWHWNVVYSNNFFNKGSQKLEMFKFNMYFHNSYPKEGVVC